MSKVWYYEDHGKAQGPVTDDQLIEKINKGELSLMDLIFKDGDQQWYPVEHYTEITQQIDRVTTSQQSEWIVLRAFEVDGKNRFEQSGPFNTDQVLELVDKGRVSFNDYVWREGFENWVSLGKVDKFEKPLVSSVEVDLSLYQLPNHQMLDSAPPVPVKTYDARKKIPKAEPRPIEAEGEDLAKPSWLVERVLRNTKITEEPAIGGSVDFKIDNPNVPVPAQEEPREMAKSLDYSEEVTAPGVSPDAINKMSKRWQSVGLFVGAASVLAGILLFGSWMWIEMAGEKQEAVEVPRQMVRKKKPAPARPAVVAETPPAPVEVVAPPAPMQEPLNEFAVKKEMAAKTETVKPAPTPGSSALKKTAKPVAVSETKAPPADTEPEAAVAKLDFSKMSAKQKAVYHHSERKFIFYNSQKALRSANDLAGLIKKKSKNPKAWKDGYAGWQASLRKLNSGELKKNGKRLYPDLYNRLKRSVSSLDERGREINAQLSAGRNPTKAASVDDIIAELKRIIAKARALDE